MRRLLSLLIFLLSAFVSLPALADQFFNYNSSWYSSQSEVESACVSGFESAAGGTGFVMTSDVSGSGGNGIYVSHAVASPYTVHGHYVTNNVDQSCPYNGFTCASGYYYTGTPGPSSCVAACPSGESAVNGVCEVNNCSDSPGTLKSFEIPAGTVIGGDGSSAVHPPPTIVADHCNYSQTGAYACSAVVGAPSAYTCTSYYQTDGSPGTSDTPDITPGNSDCNGSACASKTNCGSFDGKYVCLGNSPSPGQCTFSSGGDGFCTVDPSSTAPYGSPSPPAPDNGTPGQTAPPDATFGGAGAGAGGGGTTVNAYGPGSTSGSSTGGGPATGSSVGSGPGAPASASSSGGLTCGTIDKPCEIDWGKFTAPDAPAVASTVSVENSITSGLTGLDLYSKLQSLAFPSGGAPPSASFQAFGQTYTFEVPQPVLDSVVPVLQSVMLAVWALVAIRLVGEA